MTLEEIYSKKEQTKARVEDLNAEISALDARRNLLSQERSTLLDALSKFQEFQDRYLRLVDTFNQKARR